MYKDILLPIDLIHKESCKKALEVAIEICTAFDSKLHILTVIPDSGLALVGQYFKKTSAEDFIKQARESLKEFVQENIPEKVQVQRIVTSGNVYESIISSAKKISADLIIMSAHRPELKDYLLGPNAARVVRHSDKSVMVVRDD